jgi:outer membrane protein TolC
LHHDPTRTLPAPGLAGLALASAALVTLTACRTYAPHPLDPAAHLEAWHGRGAAPLEPASLPEDLALPGLPEAFEPDDGVDLAEGRLLALVHNPELRLARLRAGVASAGLAEAGLLADPELSLDILRDVEGLSDPWVVGAGLTFAVPLTGRREAQRGHAAAGLAVEQVALREAAWDLLHRVDVAWLEWTAGHRRKAELEGALEAVAGLAGAMGQLAERGEVPSTEAALFELEVAQRRGDLLGLAGELAAAEESLRGLLGLAPGAPVELLPGRLATDGAPGDPDALAERSPTLARLRAEHAAAEEALRLEVARQWSDLRIGPQLENDAGSLRLGALGALPLPAFDGNRRAIAEAVALRELARAAVEAGLEVRAARWAVAVRRAQALAGKRAHLEEVVRPLAETQVADASALLRLGEGSTLVLLESLARSVRARLDLIDTRAAEALARAEAAWLVGPAPTPRTDLAEEVSR